MEMKYGRFLSGYEDRVIIVGKYKRLLRYLRRVQTKETTKIL